MKESGIKGVFNILFPAFQLGRLNKVWRKVNKHNKTKLGMICDVKNITVGNFSYGVINSHDFNSDVKLKIGHFVSIADDVHFMLAGNHNVHRITTFPIKASILGMGPESSSKGDIVIGDDVWIGRNVTIMSGIKIGQGVIIAAGSIVTRDVEPYAVVAGVPARVIKYRFSQEEIDLLKKIDYSKIERKMLEQEYELLYTSDIESVLKVFPQKDIF